MPVRHEHEHRVTPLELFFDLVFVFGFTQVTSMLADDPTWPGLARGLLVLAALWWLWVGYSWLTNALDPEEGGVRLAMFAAMAALLVAALAVPQAFGDHGIAFGVAYLVARVLQHFLLMVASEDDPAMRRGVRRFTPVSFAGAALILAAGFADGDTQAALWVLALGIEYLSGLAAGSGFSIHPAHFAERHGLIVIVAIGESIVAVGVASDAPLDRGVLTAAVLGIVLASALWWSYFDWFSIGGQQVLANASGSQRAILARDLYSYLHLPMVAGIVLFALAMKNTLAHVGDELTTIPAIGLCGGPALYLLTFSAFRLRVQRRVSRGRLVAALVLLALLPLARDVPAVGALALVAAVWVVLLTYELLRHREERAELRAMRA